MTAEKNGDIAYLDSDWNEGIMPWDFGQPYDILEATDVLRGSIFTDRGVYRPGEEVHVKGILRADTPNGVRLFPAGSTLEIDVTDSRNKDVDHRTVTVNRWSSVEWTWTVPADATLGNYRIRTRIPRAPKPAGNDVAPPPSPSPGDWLKEVNGSFLVAAYRRPDFRVDATLTAAAPVAGTTVSGSLTARYLFGGTMSGRPVRWSIMREPDLDIPAAITERFAEDIYAFGYESEGEDNRPAERIAGGDVALDANGTLAVSAPTTNGLDRAFRYTFEGDVEDVSRQHIANRSSMVVHPAPWYIGVRRPAYFADAAAGTSVDVVAVDLNGHAVAGVPVTVTVNRVQWNSVRHAEGGGFYNWDTEEVRVPAGTWTVTSADTPVHVAIPVPEGGFYEVAATAADDAGHHAKTATEFYALGAGYTAWQRFDHNRITIRAREEDVEARRDGANHDSVAVGISHRASHRGARGHSPLRALRADVHATDRERADHRGGHSERVRLGAARARPDVEGCGRGRERSGQTAIPPGLRGS